jgi:hypothetical protein
VPREPDPAIDRDIDAGETPSPEMATEASAAER